MTLTAEPPVQALIGQHVRLWPYARGVYSRDVLFRLWQVIEQTGSGPRLLWGAHDPPDIHADLTAIVKYFDDPNRCLLIVTNPDGSEIAGCLWFDDLIPKFRAFGSIFMRPHYAKAGNQEAMRLGLRYAFEVLDVQTVWGVTPWEGATRLCLQCGFEVMANLPAFTRWQDKPHGVTILRITKESFHG